MDKIISYCSVHNHTEFSNLKLIDSINRSKELMNYAYELQLSGLAITDHDCLSGHHKAVKEYEAFINKKFEVKKDAGEIIVGDEEYSFEDKIKAVNFKLILGNEIYLTREGLTSETSQSGEDFFHVILLAKDEIGHKQIRELSSRAWKRSWVKAILRTPTYPSDLFEVIKGGHVICTTACIGGYTGRMFLRARDVVEGVDSYLSKIDNFLAQMDELFGHDNFFVELQPSLQEDQISYNKFMIESYWDTYNFIYATDRHFLKEEDRLVHKDFLNSKSSNDREVDLFYSSAYMMSGETVYSFFNYVDEDKMNIMTDNTNKIKNACSYYSLAQNQVVTQVPYDEIEDNTEVFQDLDNANYPFFQYFLHTEDETDRYFIKLVANGYVKKFNVNWNHEAYAKRLEEELWTLKTIKDTLDKNLSDYFISMERMINIIWNDGDSIVGPSRGSAGAFLCNYLLGITQMNPLEQDIELPV